MIAGYANDVLQPALAKTIAKAHRVAVTRIRERDRQAHTSAARSIKEVQRDLPLALKFDGFRDADSAQSLGVAGPFLRQVQLHPYADAALFSSDVNARGYLAVVRSPQGPRILPSNTYGIRAFLGETRVVEDDDLEPRHLALNQVGEPRANDIIIPARYDDGLLQSLTHGLDLCVRVDEPRG